MIDDSDEKILPIFQYRAPTPENMPQIDALRRAATEAYQAVIENSPPCRARSLAVSFLETSFMWAIKATIFGEETNRA